VHDRGDYDFGDSRAGSRSGPTYRRRRDEDQYASEYGDSEYGEHDDEGEEHTPRRRPTKAIMAVLALAVFGSAAAYGYRHLINGPSSEAPPIIRADNSPTKITPMSDVKADGGRIGDRGGEQLVRRDEDPVNLGTRAGGAAPGGGSSEAVVPGDPRRVQTVPIRADQGTASSPDRPASRTSAPPQPQTQAALAAPPPAPRQAVAPPLPAPQRQAAVAPAVSAPPPDTSQVDSGGYVVQLSAVRSEADAQTAFRQLQAKYPVLSGRQPLIRRKDQGEKGIFFAAQVGPFGAKSEAEQLCGELKAAGGSCFVQRN
jgi:cell division septation protein DedD